MTQPIIKLRDKTLSVTVWENKSEKGTSYYSTSLTKSYKDGEDNWQETTNLSTDDLLKAANLLQQAYNKILAL